MRDLRFRVWDSCSQQYHLPYDGRPAVGVTEPFYLTMGGHLVGHDGTLSYPVDQPLVVEQYTGLKDVDDKEVYEGDLVQEVWSHAKHPEIINLFNPRPEDYIERLGTVGTVTYGIGVGDCRVGFHVTFTGGSVTDLGIALWRGEVCQTRSWRVVGNVHQHQELLKEVAP